MCDMSHIKFFFTRENSYFDSYEYVPMKFSIPFIFINENLNKGIYFKYTYIDTICGPKIMGVYEVVTDSIRSQKTILN